MARLNQLDEEISEVRTWLDDRERALKRWEAEPAALEIGRVQQRIAKLQVDTF